MSPMLQADLLDEYPQIKDELRRTFHAGLILGLILGNIGGITMLYAITHFIP